MNRKDLEVFVARLRREFAAAYEAERAAAAHAVLLMRRLVIAEALLDTFIEPADDEHARSSGPGLSETIPASPVPSPSDSGPTVEGRNLHETPPEVGDDPSCSDGSTATHGRAASTGESPAPTNTPRSRKGISHAPHAPRECAKGCGRVFTHGPAAKSHERRCDGPSPTPEPRAKARDRAQPATTPKAVPAAKPEPRFPAPATSMEWDLPKRRESTEPDPEMPRRAIPRHGGGSGVAIA